MLLIYLAGLASSRNPKEPRGVKKGGPKAAPSPADLKRDARRKGVYDGFRRSKMVRRTYNEAVVINNLVINGVNQPAAFVRSPAPLAMRPLQSTPRADIREREKAWPYFCYLLNIAWPRASQNWGFGGVEAAVGGRRLNEGGCLGGLRGVRIAFRCGLAALARGPPGL
jgi:hypothetical protein